MPDELIHPEWWPYGEQFPDWDVWEGVSGLLYARRPRSSPAKVARAETVDGLRDGIIAARHQ
jgi:hypothetical protein